MTRIHVRRSDSGTSFDVGPPAPVAVQTVSPAYIRIGNPPTPFDTILFTTEKTDKTDNTDEMDTTAGGSHDSELPFDLSQLSLNGAEGKDSLAYLIVTPY